MKMKIRCSPIREKNKVRCEKVVGYTSHTTIQVQIVEKIQREGKNNNKKIKKLTADFRFLVVVLQQQLEVVVVHPIASVPHPLSSSMPVP